MSATSPRLFFGSRSDTALAVLLGVLLLAAFLPTLLELGEEWVTVAEYGHGLLMPPVAAWIIWTRRKELKQLRRRPGNAWLPFAAAMAIIPLALLLLLGEMRFSWFLKPFAFVGAVAACIAVLYSWRGLRALAAPLVVLFLMCPLPWRLVLGLTLPLRRHASVIATGLMDLTGLDASLQGNLIHAPGMESLWIADQCSGIRSLISLASIAVLGCLVWKRHWLIKVVVVLSAIPVAILANGLRLWMTAWLAVKMGPETAQGFFHLFEGFLLFLTAALLLFGWAALLSAILPRRRSRPVAWRPAGPALAPRASGGAPRLAVAVAAVLLAVTVVCVYRVRGVVEGDTVDRVAVARMESALRGLPLEVAGGLYRGETQSWDRHVIDHSGADAYGSVRYTDVGGRTYQVYIGGAVRNADNFHAPNVCMPAANWETLATDSVPCAALPIHPDTPRVQRLLLQRGDDRMLTYYWFQAGPRVAGEEWSVRLYRLLDLLRDEPLTPTMIVTVYVPVQGDVEATDAAAQQFMSTIGPYLREVTASGDIHG